MAKQWRDGIAYDLWIRRVIKNFVDWCNKNKTISAMFMFKEYRRTNVLIVLNPHFIINYKMHGIVTRSRLTTSLFFLNGTPSTLIHCLVRYAWVKYRLQQFCLNDHWNWRIDEQSWTKQCQINTLNRSQLLLQPSYLLW